ncbi:hypothetical protein TNIN_403251 [Trichonephila inaurata madagascariensis]|uniref:Uncharacterized protein n=1 Tax=Trichonephila inaurata madagascariensis TaxID=2747483 RepID=A0A8X6WV91_9ARAC|nr:hypothetical protein TNIN_403251 [Trichonephila inaurata madagascariensis]
MRMLRIVKQNVRFFSNTTGNIKGEPKNKSNLEFKVRSMRIEDIPQIVELTRLNNFQFPVSALKFWHTQDPDGMKAAVTESG